MGSRGRAASQLLRALRASRLASRARARARLAAAAARRAQPKRVGDLYEMFGVNFAPFIESIATSQVRNTAPLFAADEYLVERSTIENAFARNVSAAISDVHATLISLQLRRLQFTDEFVATKLSSIVRRDLLRLGKTAPGKIEKLSLGMLWRQARNLTATIALAKLSSHGVDVDLGSSSESTIASMLDALKEAAAMHGLHDAADDDVRTLSDWVKTAQRALRLNYRDVLCRHGLILPKRWGDDAGVATLERHAAVRRALDVRRLERIDERSGRLAAGRDVLRSRSRAGFEAARVRALARGERARKPRGGGARACERLRQPRVVSSGQALGNSSPKPKCFFTVSR